VNYSACIKEKKITNHSKVIASCLKKIFLNIIRYLEK